MLIYYDRVSFFCACWMSKGYYNRPENAAAQQKNQRKSTYPPPADGPCVLFLCKSGCSANEPAAQAGRGALQVIVDCTECKVLKGGAAWLHGGAQRGRRGRSGEVPGFIELKMLKGWFRCVLKTGMIFTEGGCLRAKRVNPLRTHALQGFLGGSVSQTDSDEVSRLVLLWCLKKMSFGDGQYNFLEKRFTYQITVIGGALGVSPDLIFKIVCSTYGLNPSSL